MKLPPISVDLIAECTADVAVLLVDWDHHRVVVDGRAAVMLTYHWHPMDSENGYQLAVVFEHAMKHPKAPDEIQEIVEQLEFTLIL